MSIERLGSTLRRRMLAREGLTKIIARSYQKHAIGSSRQQQIETFRKDETRRTLSYNQFSSSISGARQHLELRKSLVRFDCPSVNSSRNRFRPVKKSSPSEHRICVQHRLQQTHAIQICHRFADRTFLEEPEFRNPSLGCRPNKMMQFEKRPEVPLDSADHIPSTSKLEWGPIPFCVRPGPRRSPVWSWGRCRSAPRRRLRRGLRKPRGHEFSGQPALFQVGCWGQKDCQGWRVPGRRS